MIIRNVRGKICKNLIKNILKNNLIDILTSMFGDIEFKLAC